MSRADELFKQMAKEAGFTDEALNAFVKHQSSLTQPNPTPTPIPPNPEAQSRIDLFTGKTSKEAFNKGQEAYKKFNETLKNPPIVPTPAVPDKGFAEVMKQKIKQAAKEESDRKYTENVITNLGEKLPEDAKITIPLVKRALEAEGVTDPDTLAYALATIQHETAGTFRPVREGYYADTPGNEGATGRAEATKRGYSGGPEYYGRGYIQLTHDYNYKDMGDKIGEPDLATNPDKALDPNVSAKILAKFFKDNGVTNYTQKGDFYNARQPINGTDKADVVAEYANKWKKALSPQMTPEETVRSMTYR